MVTFSLQRHVCVTSTCRNREKSHNNDRSFPRRVTHEFTQLAGVVYLFVLGSFHTEYVGEETSSESKRRGKTPKTQPMKIDS